MREAPDERRVHTQDSLLDIEEGDRIRMVLENRSERSGRSGRSERSAGKWVMVVRPRDRAHAMRSTVNIGESELGYRRAVRAERPLTPGPLKQVIPDLRHPRLRIEGRTAARRAEVDTG